MRFEDTEEEYDSTHDFGMSKETGPMSVLQEGVCSRHPTDSPWEVWPVSRPVPQSLRNASNRQGRAGGPFKREMLRDHGTMYVQRLRMQIQGNCAI